MADRVLRCSPLPNLIPQPLRDVNKMFLTENTQRYTTRRVTIVLI